MIDETVPKELQEEFDRQDKEMAFTKETGLLPPRHIENSLRELSKWMSFSAITNLSFDVSIKHSQYDSYLNFANDPLYAKPYIKVIEDRIEWRHPVVGTNITINKAE